MIAPAVALSSVWSFASAPHRANSFQSSPDGLEGFPGIAGRFELARRSLVRSNGQADSVASHEVLCPSAPAHRAALSGAAGHRTIPLRLLGWLQAAPPEVFSANDGTGQLAHAVFRNSTSAAYAGQAGMDLAAGHASRLSIFVRDVPLPAVARFAAPPERQLIRRRSWAFVPSQCCSCTEDFAAFPLVVPHMPSVNFHLEAVFSRGTGRLIPFRNGWHE
jgi:hypothetical protein